MTDLNKKSGSGTDAADAAQSGPKEITINLGQVVAVVLLVLVIPLGFMLGRRLGAPAQPSSAPIQAAGAPAAPGAVDPNALLPGRPGGGAAGDQTGAQLAAAPVSVVGQDGAQSQQAAIEPSGEMMPGQVIPLGEPNHPLIGKDFIDVSGVTLDGKKISLSSYKGKPVMLNFWATWCPPCRVEMPFMQDAYAKYKDQGFTVLAVDAGEKVGANLVEQTVKDFITQSGFTFNVMLADDTYGSQMRYNVSALPSTFLIDKNGKVVDTHRGMYPNRATLDDQIVRRLGFKASDS